MGLTNNKHDQTLTWVSCGATRLHRFLDRYTQQSHIKYKNEDDCGALHNLRAPVSAVLAQDHTTCKLTNVHERDKKIKKSLCNLCTWTRVHNYTYTFTPKTYARARGHVRYSSIHNARTGWIETAISRSAAVRNGHRDVYEKRDEDYADLASTAPTHYTHLVHMHVWIMDWRITT